MLGTIFPQKSAYYPFLQNFLQATYKYPAINTRKKDRVMAPVSAVLMNFDNSNLLSCLNRLLIIGTPQIIDMNIPVVLKMIENPKSKRGTIFPFKKLTGSSIRASLDSKDSIALYVAEKMIKEYSASLQQTWKNMLAGLKMKIIPARKATLSLEVSLFTRFLRTMALNAVAILLMSKMIIMLTVGLKIALRTLVSIVNPGRKAQFFSQWYLLVRNWAPSYETLQQNGLKESTSSQFWYVQEGKMQWERMGATVKMRLEQMMQGWRLSRLANIQGNINREGVIYASINSEWIEVLGIIQGAVSCPDEAVGEHQDAEGVVGDDVAEEGFLEGCQ